MPQAGINLAEAAGTTTNAKVELGPLEVVGDKGYHSNEALTTLKDWQVRSYISEPERGRRRWKDNPAAQQAVYGNRRRITGEHGKQRLRQRGELVERSFAHAYETGGMRRVHLRGRENIFKRLLIHLCGFKLSLILRQRTGKGMPRGWQGYSADACCLNFFRIWVALSAHKMEGTQSSPSKPQDDGSFTSLVIFQQKPTYTTDC